jgi:hypothetical protein
MTFSDFTSLVFRVPDGIVSLEDLRNIPSDHAKLAQEVMASLVSRFPVLRFRSGNTKGSYGGFSRGVAAVDFLRLLVVELYALRRKIFRYAKAIYVC